MDAETRAAAIGTILKYAGTDADHALLELVGWTPTGRHTAEQRMAVVAAVVPLLDDGLLNDIVRHIAAVLVRREAVAA
jgi:hypothetical protein